MSPFLHGQDPAVVGQRTVDPYRFPAGHQEAAYQVRRREVIVAGPRDEGALQPPGHVLHKACLAAAGGPFEEHWELVAVSHPGQFDLAGNGLIIGLGFDVILFGLQAACFQRCGLASAGMLRDDATGNRESV